MVSTYLSYDLVSRDLRSSMNRTASQAQVQRDTEYYKENIGKVTSVDEFVDNYRLYNYAMTAFGLDDMAYAKAFMKKVLESDLSDEDSFANKLSDARYRDFAAAYQFDKGTEVPMTSNQLDDAIGLYNQSIENLDTSIQTETNYYNAMMGEISSVDEFLSNERLRSYMFTAFEIDENTYDRDLIRGLMTSDLDDENSYFNTEILPKATSANETVSANAQTLSDIEARQTAVTTIAALEALPQSVSDIDDQISALEASKSDAGADVDAIQAEIDGLETQKAGLYTAAGVENQSEISGAISTQQAIVDSYASTLPALGAETTALVSQLNAENSTAASYLKYAAGYQNIVLAFDFNADGSVPEEGPMTEENQQSINNNYIFLQERLTKTGAMLNDEYFRSVVNTFTTVDEMFADSRVVNYLESAFGLSTYPAVVSSTLENAITSDPDDPDSYLNSQYKGREYYDNLVALSRTFNFQDDGTLPDGVLPVDESQLDILSSRYYSGYNDVDEAADEAAIEALRNAIDSFNTDDGGIATVDDLLGNSAVYEFAMKAVGLDSDEVTKRVMKQVLMSDLQDPKSFVYTLKDDRYVEFAKLFNFDTSGDLTWPVMAQSELTMQEYASQYIINKSKFADENEKEKIKSDASDESKYYQDKIADMESLDELLSDRRLIDFVLVSKGIDPDDVTDDYMKQMFQSDLDDPKSFANTEPDYRFAEIVASFNFDENGNVIRAEADSLQTDGDVMETVNLYLRQTIESQQGEDNTGVRLALYFERNAPNLVDEYDLLGDEAMVEVFRTTFGFTEEFSTMDIDQQAKYVEKNLDLSDFQDPEKLKKFIGRFTAMYDAENSTSNSPALTLLTGSSGTGISADLMLSIASLKSG